MSKASYYLAYAQHCINEDLRLSCIDIENDIATDRTSTIRSAPSRSPSPPSLLRQLNYSRCEQLCKAQTGEVEQLNGVGL